MVRPHPLAEWMGDASRGELGTAVHAWGKGKFEPPHPPASPAAVPAAAFEQSCSGCQLFRRLSSALSSWSTVFTGWPFVWCCGFQVQGSADRQGGEGCPGRQVLLPEAALLNTCGQSLLRTIGRVCLMAEPCTCGPWDHLTKQLRKTGFPVALAATAGGKNEHAHTHSTDSRLEHEA